MSEQKLIESMDRLSESINELNRKIGSGFYEAMSDLGGHLQDLKMKVEILNTTIENRDI